MLLDAEPESPEIIKNVRATLEAAQDTYEAGIASSAAVSSKTFTGILGPINVGKTRITEEIALFKPTFEPIDTITTRARKEGDPPGFVTADEGMTFAKIKEYAGEGALINYTVIPGGHIYATLPEGFRGRHNMGPLLPGSVEQISKAGFQRTNFIYIVTAGDMWKRYIDKSRQEMPRDAFDIRIDEARDSISFALANQALLTFVENIEGQSGVRNAAMEIRNIVLKQAQPTLPKEKAELYLQQMLTTAEELALH